MKIEVKVPSVGESISEATIGSWSKKNGEAVKRNDVILLLETDKASVEVVAESDGVLTTQAQAGEVVKIGAVIGVIDTDGVAQVASAPAAAAPSAPAATSGGSSSGGNTHLSPAVQRVVGERGLDPAQIQGTGKDGRITKDDAMKASPAARSDSKPAAPAAPVAAVVPSKPATGARGKRIVPMTT
ncbi:MAG TPA: E3 binding domain-containing protein, partial [Pseudobdellovibrionaceae bacterium]|nr:E3 binding domain-containing protein [Pseudobdellovibrionaceae bacterium]